jgi:uncharacterized membrane protein YbhN (UPF0104 family)
VFLFALFIPLPASLRTFIVVGIPVGIAALATFYYCLFNKWQPLSAVFRIAASLFKTKWISWAKKKAVKVERYIIDFLKFKRKEAAKIIAINLFTWTLRFVEYKLALLAVGFNATIPQLFAVMIVVLITSLIPIPASLGVLEAGQLSLFAGLGAGPYIGLVLALILRTRDMALALLGITLLSHEGVGVLDAFRRKVTNNSK